MRANRMNGIGSNEATVVKEVPAPVTPPIGEPLWMMQARAHLTTRDLGAEWTACVAAWVRLEGLLNYGGASKSSLPATKLRPDEWSKWIRKGHSGLRCYESTPVITNPEDFGTAVVKWWNAIQPPVRRGSDQLPKAIYKNPDDVEGDIWSFLRKGGPNGLISILTPLVWWGQSVSLGSRWQENTLPLWRAMVVDVTHSLEAMEEMAGQKRRKHDTGVAGPSKR